MHVELNLVFLYFLTREESVEGWDDGPDSRGIVEHVQMVLHNAKREGDLIYVNSTLVQSK